MKTNDHFEKFARLTCVGEEPCVTLTGLHRPMFTPVWFDQEYCVVSIDYMEDMHQYPLATRLTPNSSTWGESLWTMPWSYVRDVLTKDEADQIMACVAHDEAMLQNAY